MDTPNSRFYSVRGFIYFFIPIALVSLGLTLSGCGEEGEAWLSKFSKELATELAEQTSGDINETVDATGEVSKVIDEQVVSVTEQVDQVNQISGVIDNLEQVEQVSSITDSLEQIDQVSGITDDLDQISDVTNNLDQIETVTQSIDSINQVLDTMDSISEAQGSSEGVSTEQMSVAQPTIPGQTSGSSTSTSMSPPKRMVIHPQDCQEMMGGEEVEMNTPEVGEYQCTMWDEEMGMSIVTAYVITTNSDGTLHVVSTHTRPDDVTETQEYDIDPDNVECGKWLWTDQWGSPPVCEEVTEGTFTLCQDPTCKDCEENPDDPNCEECESWMDELPAWEGIECTNTSSADLIICENCDEWGNCWKNIGHEWERGVLTNCADGGTGTVVCEDPNCICQDTSDCEECQPWHADEWEIEVLNNCGLNTNATNYTVCTESYNCWTDIIWDEAQVTNIETTYCPEWLYIPCGNEALAVDVTATIDNPIKLCEQCYENIYTEWDDATSTNIERKRTECWQWEGSEETFSCYQPVDGTELAVCTDPECVLCTEDTPEDTECMDFCGEWLWNPQWGPAPPECTLRIVSEANNYTPTLCEDCWLAPWEPIGGHEAVTRSETFPNGEERSEDKLPPIECAHYVVPEPSVGDNYVYDDFITVLDNIEDLGIIDGLEESGILVYETTSCSNDTIIILRSHTSPTDDEDPWRPLSEDSLEIRSFPHERSFKDRFAGSALELTMVETPKIVPDPDTGEPVQVEGETVISFRVGIREQIDATAQLPLGDEGETCAVLLELTDEEIATLGQPLGIHLEAMNEYFQEYFPNGDMGVRVSNGCHLHDDNGTPEGQDDYEMWYEIFEEEHDMPLPDCAQDNSCDFVYPVSEERTGYHTGAWCHDPALCGLVCPDSNEGEETVTITLSDGTTEGPFVHRFGYDPDTCEMIFYDELGNEMDFNVDFKTITDEEGEEIDVIVANMVDPDTGESEGTVEIVTEEDDQGNLDIDMTLLDEDGNEVASGEIKLDATDSGEGTITLVTGEEVTIEIENGELVGTKGRITTEDNNLLDYEVVPTETGGVEVTIDLEDADGNDIATGDLTLNEMGTGTGTITLADGSSVSITLTEGELTGAKGSIEVTGGTLDYTMTTNATKVTLDMESGATGSIDLDADNTGSGSVTLPNPDDPEGDPLTVVEVTVTEGTVTQASGTLGIEGGEMGFVKTAEGTDLTVTLGEQVSTISLNTTNTGSGAVTLDTGEVVDIDIVEGELAEASGTVTVEDGTLVYVKTPEGTTVNVILGENTGIIDLYAEPVDGVIGEGNMALGEKVDVHIVLVEDGWKSMDGTIDMEGDKSADFTQTRTTNGSTMTIDIMGAGDVKVASGEIEFYDVPVDNIKGKGEITLLTGDDVGKVLVMEIYVDAPPKMFDKETGKEIKKAA